MFPDLDAHLGSDIVYKCWSGTYASASEVVVDLEKLVAVAMD